MNSYVYTGNNPVNRVDPDGDAWIRNRSDKTWRYKPEGESDAKECPPGAKCNVDGLYSPEGWILKVPDNCNARINPDGRVEYQCAINPDIGFDPPCKVDREFLKDHDDWPNPYNGDHWKYERW